MKRGIVRIAVIVAFSIVFPVVSFSADLLVPEVYPTIQDAIDAAQPGDYVLVAPDSVNGGPYVENIDFMGLAITVRSDLDRTSTTLDDIDPQGTTIDGNQAGSVVTFTNMEGPDSVIEGLTITNGSASNGGGITCCLASPTIRNNTISNNTADDVFGGGGIFCYQACSSLITNNTIIGNSAIGGVSAGHNAGGIACWASSPEIKNNTITENSADFRGGGIDCYNNCSPTITDNTISGNSAYFGGGIYCHTRNYPLIKNNSIIGNLATVDGGGIGCIDLSSATIMNNTISGNSAGMGGGIYFGDSSPTIPLTIANNVIIGNSAGRGGGIHSNQSSLENRPQMIVKNIIAENSAQWWGGGICCWANASPTITNNIISGNLAEDGSGGGIFCSDDSNPVITNNTFYSNTAYSEGGGFYCSNSSPMITNTIFWHDSASAGNEIFIDSGDPAITYCDIEGGWTGEGNIDEDPLFMDPDGPDDDPSTWEDNDFHLQQDPCQAGIDNPCVDSGSGLASGIGVDSLTTMEILTTRTDRVPDADDVDMGFHYISEIGARYGNVNLENGLREKVLKINASAGEDPRRIYTVSTEEPITITMDAPPEGPLWANFALYAFIGEAGISDISEEPYGIGNFCFPTPLSGASPPQVFTLANNFGLFGVLGYPYIICDPAPTTILAIPGGTLGPMTLTLQGLIDDAGSRGPGISITNAIVLKVENP